MVKTSVKQAVESNFDGTGGFQAFHGQKDKSLCASKSKV